MNSEQEPTYDELVEALQNVTDENDMLRIRIDELTSTMRLSARGGKSYLQENEELKKANRDLRRKLDQLRSLLKDIEPLSFLEMWKIFNRGTFEEVTGQKVLPSSEKKVQLGFSSSEPGSLILDSPVKCLVDFKVVVLYGPKLDQMTVASSKQPLNYPFDLDKLRSDMQKRIPNILQCEPMPEDITIKFPFTNLEGLSEETLHAALCQISRFCYSNEMIDHYRSAIDTVFDNVVEPELDYKHNRKLVDDDRANFRKKAREAFNEAIQSTFLHMEKSGRGDKGLRPKGKPGRTPKSSIKWT